MVGKSILLDLVNDVLGFRKLIDDVDGLFGDDLLDSLNDLFDVDLVVDYRDVEDGLDDLFDDGLGLLVADDLLELLLEADLLGDLLSERRDLVEDVLGNVDFDGWVVLGVVRWLGARVVAHGHAGLAAAVSGGLSEAGLGQGHGIHGAILGRDELDGA